MWNGLDVTWPWNPIPFIGLILLCFLWLAQIEKKARIDDQKRQELADTQANIGEEEHQVGETMEA